MFAIGSKVRVKEFCEDTFFNEFVIADEEQVDLVGQEVTIDGYSDDFDAYMIKEDDGMYLWHADMLEEVES